jgi:hypothetical protein
MTTHELTFRWVNNQDFSRASPEPPLPSDTARADQQTQQDLYNALQKHMQPITMLHHGVHPFLSKVTPNSLLPFSSSQFQPDYWPALGLSDERVLQSAYNLQGVTPPLAQTCEKITKQALEARSEASR